MLVFGVCGLGEGRGNGYTPSFTKAVMVSMEEAPSLGTSCTVASYTCFSSKPIFCVVDMFDQQCTSHLKRTKDRRME